MTIRRITVLAIILGGLATAFPAQGQILEKMARDFRRNNCWPTPFIYSDRQAVRAPFAVMVQNGWRRQNILGDHHFQPDSGALTEAGRLKVEWILTHAPQQHRTIFVHHATGSEETAARLDAVQQMAARVVPTGELPPIVQTDLNEAGWPAEQVDRVSRDFFEKDVPSPRLPEKQESTTQ